MKNTKTRPRLFKASNLTFNVETKEALSYNWYVMTMPYKDGVILNTYNYSNTTIKHVYKIRKLLEQLGIKIVKEIEAPKGLQNIKEAVEYNTNKELALLAEATKKGTKASKNLERVELAKKYNFNASFLKTINWEVVHV